MSRVFALFSVFALCTAKPTNVEHGIVAAPVSVATQAISYAPVTVNSGISHQSRVDFNTPVLATVATAPVVAPASVVAAAPVAVASAPVVASVAPAPPLAITGPVAAGFLGGPAVGYGLTGIGAGGIVGGLGNGGLNVVGGYGSGLGIGLLRGH